MPWTRKLCPPLLHLEIGMVNQAWEVFEGWVDNVVEVIPPIERDARKEVQDATEKLELATEEKNHTDTTINIDVQEKSGAANLIKAQV
jgi:hypothetical protein